MEEYIESILGILYGLLQTQGRILRQMEYVQEVILSPLEPSPPTVAPPRRGTVAGSSSGGGGGNSFFASPLSPEAIQQTGKRNEKTPPPPTQTPKSFKQHKLLRWNTYVVAMTPSSSGMRHSHKKKPPPPLSSTSSSSSPQPSTSPLQGEEPLTEDDATTAGPHHPDSASPSFSQEKWSAFSKVVSPVGGLSFPFPLPPGMAAATTTAAISSTTAASSFSSLSGPPQSTCHSSPSPSSISSASTAHVLSPRVFWELSGNFTALLESHRRVYDRLETLYLTLLRSLTVPLFLPSPSLASTMRVDGISPPPSMVLEGNAMTPAPSVPPLPLAAVGELGKEKGGSSRPRARSTTGGSRSRQDGGGGALLGSQRTSHSLFSTPRSKRTKTGYKETPSLVLSASEVRSSSSGLPSRTSHTSTSGGGGGRNTSSSSSSFPTQVQRRSPISLGSGDLPPSSRRRRRSGLSERGHAEEEVDEEVKKKDATHLFDVVVGGGEGTAKKKKKKWQQQQPQWGFLPPRFPVPGGKVIRRIVFFLLLSPHRRRPRGMKRMRRHAFVGVEPRYL